MFLPKRKVNKYLRKGYDLNLISRTAPSNPNFAENDAYIKTGDGYRQVLHIPNNGYPERNLPTYWASELLLINDATIFRFFKHASSSEVSEETAKSISNLLHSSNRNSTDDADDENLVGSLMMLRNDNQNNVPVKEVGTSFYIAADTEALLRQKARDVKSRLQSYTITSNDGMQDVEYHMPFIPASFQPSLPTRRKLQPITVDTLAAGYPFNHTTLMDPHGTFLGSTRTGGVIYFDLLHKDSERLAPTMLIAGQNNVGKGKLLAKQLDALFAKGHTIINIDLNGSLKDLTQRQGGLHIDITDGQGEYHINPMQVMATRMSKSTLETDQIRSFNVHRNKLKVFASMKDNTLKQTDFNNLNTTVGNLYKEYGLWELSENKQKNDLLHITDVVEEDYPLLGALVDALDADWRSAQSKGAAVRSKAESYEKLTAAFQSILDDYRFLNNYSRFFDVSDEKVLTFDLSSIDDAALLNIQLYQVLSLVASLSVKNGVKNIMTADEEEVTGTPNHCIVTITGTDRIFDPNYSQSLVFLSEMIEEIGKSDSAIILEMSSLDKILSSAKSDDVTPYVLATRNVFSQIRYRIFSQLDIVVIPKLADALRGEMTPSELESLRYLQYGQFFLNIANVKNYAFELEMTDQQDISYYGIPYAEEARYSKMR